jgi:hypothetical protein
VHSTGLSPARFRAALRMVGRVTGSCRLRNGPDGNVRLTHLRTSSAEPAQQSRHLARIACIGEDGRCPTAASSGGAIVRGSVRSARRHQARSQRRMPRRAASFLNQANRHPDSPGSTERSARTGAHALDGVRASTTTSSTARLLGAAGSIVMRPPVTARRAARRGCSNIAFAESKILVTPTRTAPGPRLNNNRVGSQVVERRTRSPACDVESHHRRDLTKRVH